VLETLHRRCGQVMNDRVYQKGEEAWVSNAEV
jgi:hypothetical protein